MEEKKFSKVQDSGKRQDFSTGSIRDTNEGKPRYDLITPIALYRLAMHYANGSAKYGDRNWEKGQPLGRYIESLERHLQKAKVGLEDEDHWSAIIWNAMAFIHTKEMIDAGALPKELNDLPEYPEKVKQLLKGE
ncbi:MAG: dATP/dGTP diphosphohydrolase domain-containing protein [Promethearchaeota archaeon]